MENYDKYVKVTDKGTKKVLSGFIGLMPAMRGKKILDVGCGTGLLTRHYAKENTVFGLDSNRASVLQAKKNGINASIADLEKKLPFKSNEFDFVVCKDVLEFIFNAETLLKEMARVTKKNGFLLLHVPNELNLMDLASILLGKGLLKKRWYASSSELNNPHVRFFTPKALSKELSSMGFSVVDYSSKWSFTIPLLKVKAGFLSRISPRLFSPGITLLCRKGKNA